MSRAPLAHLSPPPPTRAPLVSRSNQSHYGKFDVAALVENASVAVVAVDPGADGDVVGFLAVVPEFPTPHGVPKARVMELLSWTSSTSRALGYAHGASAWIGGCATHEAHAHHAVAPMLRACFLALPHLETLLHASSPEVERDPLGAHLAKVSKMERHALYETSRAHVAPRLRVRAAKVEDNDDLIPLVSAVAADPAAPGGALSRVPVSGDDDPSGRPGSSSEAEEGWPGGDLAEEYAVARLVDDALADPARKRVLVAEHADTGRLVGLMALEALDESARARLASDYDAAAYDDFRLDDEGTAEEETTGANAFRVTRLILAPEVWAQSPELLDEAFAGFPDKDFCVVTVSLAAPELPLAKLAMTRLAAESPDADEALFAAHRAGTLPDFDVRVATAEDAPEVEALLAGVPDAEGMTEAFREAAAEGAAAAADGEAPEAAAAVATCEGQVVGYVIFGFDVDVESLATCFDLGAVVDEAQHGADAHAHLEECVMNPVFAHRKKAVVLDAMRLFRKTLATYRSGAEPQGGEIPDVVACDFRLCAGRKPLEGLRDANFALFAFTNRIAAAPRVAVNARVVVVGATETALATVDRLASHPTAAFNNVALVAAGGGLVIQKNGGAGSAAYDAAGVAKLALGSAAGAQVVDAEMTGLDRANKAVLLSDGTELPYDVLALATGHRDQTRVAMDAADDVPIERLDDLVSNLTREEAAAIESVLVYGDTLEALGATRKLLSVGVRPEAVREIAPPSDGGALSLRRFAMEAALQTPGLGRGALEVPGKPPAVEGATLAGAEACDAGVRAYFTRENENKKEKDGGDEEVLVLEADFLVACDVGDVDPVVFQSLDGAGIVFDGDVVVGADFSTNDPDVYAAGESAKFSRRLERAEGRRRLPMRHNDAKEVGFRLADAIIARAEKKPRSLARAPDLHRAKCESAILPSGARFCRAASPEAHAAPSLEPPRGGRTVETRAEGRFCRLDVDREGIITAFAYCGDERVDARTMGRLVGLPVTVLDGVLGDEAEEEARGTAEGEKTQHLLEKLQSPHLAAVYHEGFARAHRALMDVLRRGPDPSEFQTPIGPSGVAAMAQEATIAFVERHANDFPTKTYRAVGGGTTA